MIFRQVFDNKSSTYTYLIASAKGREAVIIDPVIENVESYIELLNELDLKLVKNYEGKMIGFEDQLSDKEIDSILAYVKSFWPIDKYEYQINMSK